MRILFLILAAALFLSAQSIETQSDAALIAQPGQELELKARVLTAAGAPLANTEVYFTSPNRPDFGQFPSATAPSKTWIAATSDATGVVTVRYRMGTQPGFGLLNASIAPRTTGVRSVSYAITNGIPAPSTSLTVMALRTAVRQSFLTGGVESVTQRLHGPFLLPSGATVNSASSEDPADTYFPRTLSNPEWFLWIDDNAQAGFAHGVRFVRVPLSATAAQVRTQAAISYQYWWPVARLATGPTQPLLGAEGENDFRRGPSRPAGRFASSQLSAAPADACLVLVRGPDVALAAEGLGDAANAMIERGLVSADNVFSKFLDGPDGKVVRAMDRKTLDEIFVQLKQKPCRKIYFLYDGHGSPANWGGGLCLVAPADAPDTVQFDTYSYETLAKQLKDLGNVEVNLILSACFSGQAIPWMQGIGLTGEIVTVSSATQVGYQQTMYWEIAPSLGKTDQTWQGIQTDLKNSTSAKVAGSNPQFGTINASGTRRMSVPYVFMWYPGSTVETINRPATAIPTSPFRADLFAVNPIIGSYPNPAINMASGVATTTTTAGGYRPGITAVNGTGAELGTQMPVPIVNYAGLGHIQVGRITLNPMDCYIAVGSTPCQVTITRHIPIPDVDNGGTFTIEVTDPTTATVSVAEVVFASKQTTGSFAVTGLKEGTTTVRVTEKQSGYVESVNVDVYTPTIPTPTVPTACVGTFPFLVSTLRTNNEHTCCTSEVSNLPLNIIINANGTINATGDGRNFPLVFNGTVNLLDCRITLRGIMPVSSFQTESTLTGQIGPPEVLNNSDRSVSAGGRSANFDSLKFQYRIGSNGALPGSTSAEFSGTGRLTASSACTYELSNPTLQVTSNASTQFGLMKTGATCAWTATRTGDFISLVTTSGTGPGRVYFQLTANNTNSARSGTISAGGRTLAVSQPGLSAGTPIISGVVNGASFGPFISSGSWVTITGSNLSATTRTWGSADFIGTQLPASIDGVSVTMNNLPALIYFVSPGQLNVLAPDGLTGQSTTVIVRRGATISNRFAAYARDYSNGFFLFDADGRKYPAAVHADGTLVGRVGLYPGLTTRPVKPGDIILLYLTGLGETNPPTPADRLVAGAPPIRAGVSVRLGTAKANVLFSGKVSSGLYQINLQIPNVPAGDQPLEASIEGRRSQAAVSLTVAEP
jgi:uncharacterized protein (TIGR03437 family)